MDNTIRDWIIAQLNSVPNIGTVHGYQRYADRENQLATLYQHEGKLHGWFVRRASVVEKSLTRGINTEQTTWLIQGYLALHDAVASELEFDALLDAIRAVFRTDAFDVWRTLSNDKSINVVYTDQPAKEQLGFAVVETMPVLFAGVLCHSAQCQLITHRTVNT
jgi:non-ribosomal peptide synthetase component F